MEMPRPAATRPRIVRAYGASWTDSGTEPRGAAALDDLVVRLRSKAPRPQHEVLAL